jgi:DNA modification methylase
MKQANINKDSTQKIKAKKAIEALEKSYQAKLIINPKLSRTLVSFQANKAEPIFRLFKYKEGFSKQLIDYCLDEVGAKSGDVILEPFAGTGATVFTSAQRGLDAVAIELLPVGCEIMKIRQLIKKLGPKKIINYCEEVIKNKAWKKIKKEWSFPHIAITKEAFPVETEDEIGKFKTWLEKLEKDKAEFLSFILLCVLEEISFTRKDGQYLRWDHRSARKNGKGSFDKGVILSFDEAIERKLKQVISDYSSDLPADLFEDKKEIQQEGNIRIEQGTVFEQINQIPDLSINYVITSPPYCNRYDYTRTYALELAYLGVGETGIRELRQALLTCTVENKPKNFAGVSKKTIEKVNQIFNKNEVMSAILDFLQSEKDANNLNNNGILTMVKGYFYETAIHIAQISKKIRKGGYYLMVNDNVQYNGLAIPVDCLLSSFAEDLGFSCEKIWVLPKGKGNSSQQMKQHGRNELRKCVYVWKKQAKVKLEYPQAL